MGKTAKFCLNLLYLFKIFVGHCLFHPEQEKIMENREKSDLYLTSKETAIMRLMNVC